VIPAPEYSTVADAAHRLGITPKKAYVLLKAGEFPCRVFRVGVEWRIPTAELDRLAGIEVAS
jgi:excisionase family DNA binding protein